MQACSDLIMDDLSIKKCVPCDMKEFRPMTEEAANTLTDKVPEWELENEAGILKLHRSWKVKTFIRGLEFFDAVGKLAEAEGGLTENDFILAAKIDRLDLHHLLSRKVAK